jgi:hypothetical protein
VPGAAAGISWGFVAAVIKELSSRLGEGINAVTTSWLLYVLIVTGAATLVLSSRALTATAGSSVYGLRDPSKSDRRAARCAERSPPLRRACRPFTSLRRAVLTGLRVVGG